MNPPGYPVDLHAHSLWSDGAHAPSELVRLAAARGVRVLALSDHDTLAGTAEAIGAGERLCVRVIPAVELNTESSWGDVHVLAYHLDPADAALESRLRWLRENRGRRMELMVERLSAMGYPVSIDRVREIAAGGASLRSQGPLALGRPHLAQALVEAGHVDSYERAFEALIGKNSSAYVERVGLSPLEAIRLAVEHGGVASLAHPGTVRNLTEVLPELVNAGLAGLEVYYPSHDAATTAWLRALAQAHDLVATGGSDFHGRGEREHALGFSYVPPETVPALEARRLHSRPVDPGPTKAALTTDEASSAARPTGRARGSPGEGVT